MAAPGDFDPALYMICPEHILGGLQLANATPLFPRTWVVRVPTMASAIVVPTRPASRGARRGTIHPLRRLRIMTSDCEKGHEYDEEDVDKPKPDDEQQRFAFTIAHLHQAENAVTSPIVRTTRFAPAFVFQGQLT
ncbi:hypothetical protein BDZ97DRAFT_1759751 [Flammula alnicola]|nr:hypothetical protein BDZ97DRAFT_1759751 [Flammula alnicola]